MDWSRIKTIFILTFLVLNIYLMYEFFKLKDSSQLEFSIEPSVENRLKADEIEYTDLPKNYQKDSYLRAKPKVFTDEDLETPKLKGQQVKVIDGTTLSSVLDKPIKINDKIDVNELNMFVKNHILHGDQYRFWGKEGNEITFYQQYGDKLIYKNISGELTLYLNDDHTNIVSYRQTFLEDIEKLSEAEKIIQPIKVIETIYKNGSLKPKSKITKVELGYFSFVNTSTLQVLTPAWRLVVNDEKNIFIHAFEGTTIEFNIEEKKIVE